MVKKDLIRTVQYLFIAGTWVLLVWILLTNA